jgi:hypothetical protein
MHRGRVATHGFSVISNYLVLTLSQVIHQCIASVRVFPSIEGVQFSSYCVQLFIRIEKLSQKTPVRFLNKNEYIKFSFLAVAHGMCAISIVAKSDSSMAQRGKRVRIWRQWHLNPQQLTISRDIQWSKPQQTMIEIQIQREKVVLCIITTTIVRSFSCFS